MENDKRENRSVSLSSEYKGTDNSQIAVTTQYYTWLLLYSQSFDLVGVDFVPHG